MTTHDPRPVKPPNYTAARARKVIDATPDGELAKYQARIEDAFIRMASCSCYWCVFFQRSDRTCHVDGPRLVRTQGVSTTEWPKVGADDWCGKWETI